MNSDEITKPMAPPACWRSSVSPRSGTRHAVGDVHQAEHAEQQRRPADDLPAGGAVALGVAQVAPGDEAQQQRDEPAEQADRAVDDGAHAVADAAGQLPPDGGGHDDRERRSGTARPRRAGARARAPGRCARPCGRSHPARGRHRARPRRRPARGRVRARQWGQCRCGRLAVRGASTSQSTDPSARACYGTGCRTTGSRIRTPSSRLVAAGLEVPLFRDAGGEDVRVAMVRNLHRCHSSPRPHTPGRGAPTWAVHGTRPIAGSVSP